MASLEQDEFQERRCHLKGSPEGPEGCGNSSVLTPTYPFAVVLRLRVFQVVCGISGVVMGAVAFIEERGRLHLGLGMPAGILTVAAAAVSIHTSRGFSGYRSPSCVPPSIAVRFLGPTVGIAVPLTLLWTASVGLHLILMVFCLRSLIMSSPNHSSAVTIVLLVTTLLSLTAVILVLSIDCRYDPDGPNVLMDPPQGPSVWWIVSRTTSPPTRPVEWPAVGVVDCQPDERPGRVAWAV